MTEEDIVNIFSLGRRTENGDMLIVHKYNFIDNDLERVETITDLGSENCFKIFFFGFYAWFLWFLGFHVES